MLILCVYYATSTELYTYRHTLALHVALPISLSRPDPAMQKIGAGRVALAHCGNHRVLAPDSIQQGRRSEEHTSELQSLMRIAYAAFCLKTKTLQQLHATIVRSTKTLIVHHTKLQYT